MVDAHSFDIRGARAGGYRGAFVNRYNLPLTVPDFFELASYLLARNK